MPAGTNLSSLRRQPPGVHITSLSSMLGQVQQHQHQQQLLVGRRPTGISSVSVGTHNSTSGAVAAAFGGGAMSTVGHHSCLGSSHAQTLSRCVCGPSIWYAAAAYSVSLLILWGRVYLLIQLPLLTHQQTATA